MKKITKVSSFQKLLIEFGKLMIDAQINDLLTKTQFEVLDQLIDLIPELAIYQEQALDQMIGWTDEEEVSTKEYLEGAGKFQRPVENLLIKLGKQLIDAQVQSLLTESQFEALDQLIDLIPELAIYQEQVLDQLIDWTDEEEESTQKKFIILPMSAKKQFGNFSQYYRKIAAAISILIASGLLVQQLVSSPPDTNIASEKTDASEQTIAMTTVPSQDSQERMAQIKVKKISAGEVFEANEISKFEQATKAKNYTSSQVKVFIKTNQTFTGEKYLSEFIEDWKEGIEYENQAFKIAQANNNEIILTYHF